MRKLIICSGILAAWTLSPGVLLAFEQTPVVTPVPGTTLVDPGDSANGLGASGNLAPALDAEKESGFSFPGLGSFNILPKLDFGLELLYGASPEQPVEDEPPHEDVSIRGSVKKRF